MDYSFCFDTMNLGWSIVCIEGSHIIISTYRFFFVFTNTGDPDGMARDSTFRLGLHCSPEFALRSYQYTKGYFFLFLKWWFQGLFLVEMR